MFSFALINNLTISLFLWFFQLTHISGKQLSHPWFAMMSFGEIYDLQKFLYLLSLWFYYPAMIFMIYFGSHDQSIMSIYSRMIRADVNFTEVLPSYLQHSKADIAFTCRGVSSFQPYILKVKH